MTYLTRKTAGPFQQTLNKVISSLREKGFEGIHVVDMQDALFEKLHIRFRNYRILAMFHPELAYKAISMESHLGAMLQCNVVVQEHENGEIEITAVNPLEVVDRSYVTLSLEQVASEMSNLLREAIDDVHRDSPEYHGEALPLEDYHSRCQMPIQG